MQTKFKRHQKVKLLFLPLVEDIEPYPDPDEDIEIKPGMIGEINLMLPNGRYHLKVFNEKQETIAYVVLDEEALEALDPESD